MDIMWLIVTALFLDADNMFVMLMVNESDGIIFPEDVGTINVTISLSGPRIVNTTVQLSVSSNQATGIVRSIVVCFFMALW